MISIAICDDSKVMREQVKKNLLNYSMQKELEYTVDEYNTGEMLLAADKKYNLIFMDYQFDNSTSDGLSIAKKIRENDKEVVIIFVSSYPGIVFKSFEVGTFRFLVKPIEEDKFFTALDSFIQMMENDEVLKIRVDGTNFFFKESTITHIEGYGKNCVLNFSDGREPVECHETLGAVEERLSKKYFYRCYKSYLVNMKHIDSYDRDEITLDTGAKLQISRMKYKEFNSIYSEYLVKIGG
ncbi:LytR/AlgR family response regulator transcription factor [Butyrivibrio sp. YAB3001]|uniref:LytR/AlgR family response regulator transcription factor n=1 Tax=Butyrivibrio sp. YAB3001 TaxID=1520812 RepID=UPI0008F67403|nr:LytTR family DNA-binding domain-containing protein [Butyrivibrio sp. YAB3001]SFC01958.1 two component transcriptional regulator, LytTR family [Butyrivibrio sp. YAB3001]